jgi:23S rRNA pseudouridine2605 synthase/23S rRNA pseudouridine2604 synthase
MERLRLQKYLSQSGVCSRRAGESLIREGRVSVNGSVVTEMGFQIDPFQDRVSVDGKPVKPEEQLLYIALNKPAGYVCSCSQRKEKLVLDLVSGLPGRVYPVGRLDKDSTGLLLLTNDGRLHHRLSHPSFDHEKEYEVTVARPLSDDDLKSLSEGVPLDGVMTRPARVTRLSRNGFRIVLKEGRNRQIRRMVTYVGNSVRTLNRVRIVTITLGRLREGVFRHLTEKETRTLLKQVLTG